MRRSTLFAVSVTALVLIVAGQWPAVVGDAGWQRARVAVTHAMAWRPAPRIAPPPPRRADARPGRPHGLPAEAVAALAAGSAMAALIALAAGGAWLLRPRPVRRRQPLDARRWLARDARAAR